MSYPSMMAAGARGAMHIALRVLSAFIRGKTLRLVLRLIAAIPGGYALTAAAVAVCGGLLTLVGMTRSEAVVLSAMLGFVFYLLLLLWAFAERSLARLWGVIAGGLAVCGAWLWLMPIGA